MTLVSSWTGPGGERRVFLQCDGCLPAQIAFGPVERISAAGWQYEDLERGPHRCRWCAGRSASAGLRRTTPPETSPALPNMLVIGAAKCGTTSLHRYLSLHPEMHMSAAKEVRFFQDPGCLEKLDSYATFFDGRAPVRGESSPRYTFDPLVPGVPERIRAAIPDVKLIYLVRDPIERAISQYVDWRSQRWRGEPDTFERAVGDVDDPYNEYVAAGRYATQLELFLSRFPAEQVLVVDHSRLLRDRSGTLGRIFAFLGVDRSFDSPRFGDSWNRADEKRTASGGGSEARPPSRMIAAARRRIPRGVRRAVAAPLLPLRRRSVPPPPRIESGTQARLREVFVDEVRRLRELSGEELADWPTAPRQRPAGAAR